MASTTAGTAWLVCGAPGSGKSVLGRSLAEALPAVLLDQDVLCGPLTSVVAELVGAEVDDLDDPRVRRALGTAPYEALLDAAADNLRLGSHVVLVAPFTGILGSIEGVGLLHRLGPADRRVVWARCPPEERLRRLAIRAAPRDRRKLEEPARLRADAGAPLVLPHREVDTTTPLAEQVSAALQAPIVGSQENH